MQNLTLPTAARRTVLRCRDRELDYARRTLVMGILNVTPDSFSDGGDAFALDAALERAEGLIRDGADILDVGGESSRPGAEPVPADEELRRVLPVIEAFANDPRVVLSVDTAKMEVARECLRRGAHLVNDITGLRDPGMAAVIADFDAAVCVMHMQGTPKTMQAEPVYGDVVAEVGAFLTGRAASAVDAGIARESILVDPGIGFGKTVEHNLVLLRRLSEFGAIGYPVLMGTSRKRFIGTILDAPVHDRLMGTAASVAVAIAHGANAVRVHDVREIARVVRVSDAICHGLR